jgi:hypothetical protein
VSTSLIDRAEQDVAARTDVGLHLKKCHNPDGVCGPFHDSFPRVAAKHGNPGLSLRNRFAVAWHLEVLIPAFATVAFRAPCESLLVSLPVFAYADPRRHVQSSLVLRQNYRLA